MIAGRWKILIFWRLQEGELRFSELRRCIPTITQKMLTQQLRQMEVEGLLSRKVFAQVPPKVSYTPDRARPEFASDAPQPLRLVTTHPPHS